MERRRVPNDHSCLFYAVAYACEGAEAGNDVSQRLRAVVAEEALADPDPETRSLMLGMPVSDYAEWIQKPLSWGGENEIVVLSRHFNVEIAVVSCESLSIMVYRPSPPTASTPNPGPLDAATNASVPTAPATPRGRIYLLYTGQHYDPLVGVAGEGAEGGEGRRLFDARREVEGAGAGVEGGNAPGGTEDNEVEKACLEIASAARAEAAAKAERTLNKRIKCGGCGVLLVDTAMFQSHCMDDEVADAHDDDFAFDCEEVVVAVAAGAPPLPDDAPCRADDHDGWSLYTSDPANPLSSAAIGGPGAAS